MRKIIANFSFISVLVFSVSCRQQLRHYQLLVKNPTEYIYSINIDSAHNLIFNEFNNYRYRGLSIDTANVSGYFISDSIKSILNGPNNSHDLFLSTVTPIGKSKLYLTKKGDSLDFISSFYMHLDSLDTNKTKVMVYAVHPLLLTGQDILPSPPHFVRAGHMKSIESSTIEEYEILLIIGKSLNIHMPIKNTENELIE
jgi:hypothetical protein